MTWFSKRVVFSQRTLGRLAVGVLAASGPSALVAQEAAPPTNATEPTLAPTETPEAVQPAWPELSPPVIPAERIQPADDEVRALEPVVERDDATAQRLDAVAHFMAGQVYEKRRDPLAALNEYEQALELNPDAYEVYPAFVPIAFLVGRSDDAVETARQAAARFDNGHDLIRGLAGMMAGTNRIDEAVTLLTETLNVPKVRDSRLNRLLVHRDLGIILKARGDVPEAAQQLRIVFDALEAESDDALTEDEVTLLIGAEGGASYETLGATFLEAELPDLAVRAFEKAAEADPNSQSAYSYNLASVFRKTGRAEEALDQLQIYLDAQLQSKGRAAYELLADLLKDLGREKELLSRLETLVGKDRRNVALRYFYADTLRDADQLSEAEKQYRVALGGGRDLRGLIGLIGLKRVAAATLLEADAAADVTGIGRELFEMLLKAYPIVAQSGDAAGVFEEEWLAIRESERLLDAVAAAGREQIDIERPTMEFLPAYVFGRLMVDAKRADDATAFYRYAIKLRTDSPLQLYRELGEFLAEENEHALAAEVYTEALDAASDTSPELQALLAYQLSTERVLSGDTDGAFDAIHIAQSLDPDNLGWQFWEGFIATQAQLYDQAAELFLAFIAKHEGDSEPDIVQRARYQLSNVYVQQDDIDRGAQVLLDILEKNPDDIQANNDLGYLWADAGIHLDRAEEMIRKALAAEPENPAYLDSLGWVLFRSSKFDEAIQYLEQAAELEDGQDTVIYDHLGDAYDKAGQADKARTAYEKALELERDKQYPEDDVIQKIEQKLTNQSS